MPPQPTPFEPETGSESARDFLTPEQRADAVAEILSTIALRILNQRHEQDTQSPQI